MKKYLITEQQRDAIVWLLPDATELKNLVRTIQPIEPLSDAEINQLWSNVHNDTTRRSAHQVMARAIEAHILGEKK